MIKKITILLIASIFLSCGAKDAIDDALDLNNISRKPINTSKVGANAFANDSRFGSISAQYREVQSTLGLGFVRVLMNWDDGVQPTPSSPLNFSFYDDLIDGIPAGMDVLIVTTGVPSWMRNSSNWIGGNPRITFVERWLKNLAARYANNSKISAIEIWNEPNRPSDRDNTTLDMVSNPSNYVEMLCAGYSAIKAVSSKRVVNAATTAINQNFPETLAYNRGMIDSGAENCVDIWGIHYYGKQFENVVGDGGVANFLNDISKPIWVTESGAQGVNNQLAYVETAWPFLEEKIPAIDRFYIYQFTESSDPATTYGLRNLSSDMPVSDLYIYLRDR